MFDGSASSLLVRSGRACLALAILIAALSPGVARAGDVPTVASILERADKPDAPPPQLLAQDLIDLGTTAIPKLFDALVAEAGKPRGLESRRSRVVYATCALTGIGRWRPVVEGRLVTGASPATLRAAFAVCAECGLASEIPLLARAAELDSSQACRAEFQRALTQVLVRDPSGFGFLDALVEHGSAATIESVVPAVEGTRRPEAASLLARWVGDRRELRLLALPHLSRLALALDRPFTEEVMRPVRGLLELVENETLADAIVCSGRLGDYAAVPALTRWLRTGSPGVRANSLWSLRAISGLVLDEDPGSWTTWFASEAAWWDHDAQAAFAALRSGTRLEKTRALREIAGLHAWRERLVEHVAVLLEDPDTELAVYATKLLARLGTRTAIPELLDALDNPSEDVAKAAHAALETVSGRKLPEDAGACREMLGARP